MYRVYLLALSSLLAFPALARTHAKPATSQAPEGFVLIEEDVSLNLHTLPVSLMEESIADFSKKSSGEAAGDLKAAARLFRASEDMRRDTAIGEFMRLSADNLDLIANDLRAGTITTETALKERLAQVAYYSARARRAKAAREWDRRQLKLAGYDLDAAATALERSMEWAGKEFTSDGAAAVKSGHLVAAKLIQGGGWRESDVRSALSELSTTSSFVAGKVLPAGSTAAESPGAL